MKLISKLKDLISYIEDCLLSYLQSRCEHPSNMVTVDLLEGSVDNLQVKYCHRCGSVQTLWKPLPNQQPSRYINLDHTWRQPDPHLWRGN
jgi:hypothetical protein